MFLYLYMITIKGYTQVEYNTLVGILYDAYKRLNLTSITLAYKVDATSPQSGYNAFAPDKQKLSDRLFTKVMVALGVDGFILSTAGQKFYYIKSK